MKKCFLITYEDAVGATNFTIIEAESRGQAKRIFFQKMGEDVNLKSIAEEILDDTTSKI